MCLSALLPGESAVSSMRPHHILQPMCLHGRVQRIGRILLDIIGSNRFSLCTVAVHSQLVPGGRSPRCHKYNSTGISRHINALDFTCPLNKKRSWAALALSHEWLFRAVTRIVSSATGCPCGNDGAISASTGGGEGWLPLSQKPLLLPCAHSAWLCLSPLCTLYLAAPTSP